MYTVSDVSGEGKREGRFFSSLFSISSLRNSVEENMALNK